MEVLKTISIVVGIIVTVTGVIIAIKNYKLNKESKERKKPNLDLYISNSFVINYNEFRIYGVLLLISNAKDVDNSVKDIKLIINCKKKEGPRSILKFEHNHKLANYINNKNINVLKISDGIPAHYNKAGWVLFKVNKVLLEDYFIDFYNILVTDVHGLVNKIEPIIFKEVVDEERLE